MSEIQVSLRDTKKGEPKTATLYYEVVNGEVTITGHQGVCGTLEIPAEIDGLPVKKIGEKAFNECKTLRCITFPEDLKVLESSAFFGCEFLESVTFSDGIVSIASDVFAYCIHLKSVCLPATLKVLGEGSFDHCLALETVVLPKQLKEIGRGAFARCGLRSIYIPARVSKVHSHAFDGCRHLDAITVDAKNLNYTSADGMLLDKLMRKLIAVPASRSSVEVPHSVTTIGAFAFCSSKLLTSVTLPSQLEVIKEGAFRYCSALTEIMLPEKLTTIQGLAEAFEFTSMMKFQVHPGNQHYSVMNDLLLTKDGKRLILVPFNKEIVQIPPSVEAIDKAAFPRSMIGGVTTIRVSPDNRHYKAKDGLLLSKDGKRLILVPFKKRVVRIPEGVKFIDKGAFLMYCAATKVILPESLKVLTKNALDGARRLHFEGFTVPKHITCISGDFFGRILWT